MQLSVDLASYIIAESDEKAPDSMSESFEKLRKLNLIQPSLTRRIESFFPFAGLESPA